MTDERARIPRPQEAADAILAEFAAQGAQPGWQLSYQQFLHRLPQHLRNGSDIDAGIQLLAEKGFVTQVKFKASVTLTAEGFAVISQRHQ